MLELGEAYVDGVRAETSGVLELELAVTEVTALVAYCVGLAKLNKELPDTMIVLEIVELITEITVEVVEYVLVRVRLSEVWVSVTGHTVVYLLVMSVTVTMTVLLRDALLGEVPVGLARELDPL